MMEKPRLEVVEGAETASPSVLVAGFGGALGAGLRHVIGMDDDLEMVGHDDEADVASAIAAHRPDVALVHHAAIGSPIELRRIALAHPGTGLVVAVPSLSRQRDDALLAAGARVVVPITVDTSELRGVLRLVALGLVGAPHPRRARETAGLGLLTERESEVAQLLLLRRSAREIADELHVTVATVNTHCRHIYEKLGVHGRAELAARAGELLGTGTREQAPFRRRFRPAADSGRPALVDMCSALGWNVPRLLRG